MTYWSDRIFLRGYYVELWAERPEKLLGEGKSLIRTRHLQALQENPDATDDGSLPRFDADETPRYEGGASTVDETPRSPL